MEKDKIMTLSVNDIGAIFLIFMIYHLDLSRCSILYTGEYCVDNVF